MRDLDPLEALRRLARLIRPGRPERAPLERAVGLHLAEALEPPGLEEGPRAALNGYAVGPGFEPGDHAVRLPAEAPPAEEAGPDDGEPARGPALIRVDTGDPLPPGADRVVPVDWTTLAGGTGAGPARVRIPAAAVPPPGHGVEPRPTPLRLEPGVKLTPALAALLLSRGVASVAVFPARRIGVLSIGKELVDAAAGPPGPGARSDLNGYWIESAVRALGHIPEPLGIAGDDPAEGREALLRAEKRRLGGLIATGGLGDGVEDRSAELLGRIDGKVVVERLALEPVRRILAAEWLDLRVLVLPGRPLDAAAAFDLFARPALLAALGAPAERWDWSRTAHPRDALLPPEGPPRRAPAPPATGEARAEGAPYRVVPVRREPGGERFRELVPPSTFLPFVKGQEGWAVVPPPDGAASARSPPRGFHVQSGASIT